MLLIGAAADFAHAGGAPAGFTYLRFDDTARPVFAAGGRRRQVDRDGAVLRDWYRPLLNSNIILQFGASALFPDDDARIYDADDVRYNVFTNILTTW